MSHTGLPHDAVVYPCSDGQPMAETQIHGECMMYVTAALRRWFEKHGRADVYVGSNNFLYYERGNPRAVVAPDVYVVLGASASPPRDTYMLWNEPKGPDFVLEVTSASTRRDDERRKRDVYAALGVSEYFLYDPRAEYLAPPLQVGVRPICEIQAVALARRSQKSSKRWLSTAHLRAMMALAPATVQRMPPRLRRVPMMCLQPPSTTPVATHKPIARNVG